MPTAIQSERDASLDSAPFWWKHRSEVIAAIVVVLLAAAIFTGYRVYNQHRDDAAAQMLAGAKTAQDYQRVIDQYSGTAAAASAYLLMADEQRHEGKFQDANATLKTFVEKFPQHELASSAHLSMADNFESLGKPDEALSTLQKLVANYPQSFNAPMAMLAEVPLLKAQNRLDEARRVCEDLMTRYRDSVEVGEATRQLRLLKPVEKESAAPAQTNPAASVAPTSALPQNPAPPRRP